MSPLPSDTQRRRSDAPFWAALTALGGIYVLLVAAMLTADFALTSPTALWQAFQKPEIVHALRLSLASSWCSMCLSATAIVLLTPHPSSMPTERFWE